MSDLSHIPDEAVEAAHDIVFAGEQANRHHIRMMLDAALPVLNTARDAEQFPGFYITDDDGYPALTYYYGDVDADGVHVKSAEAVTSLDELVQAARKHAASLRGEQ